MQEASFESLHLTESVTDDRRTQQGTSSPSHPPAILQSSSTPDILPLDILHPPTSSPGGADRPANGTPPLRIPLKTL